MPSPATFGMTPLWIYRAGAGPAALFGWLAGAYGQGRGGARFPGRQKLAAALGVSVRTVSRWLSKLREIGAVVSHQRVHGTRYSSNRYWLTWDDPQFSQVGPRATGGAHNQTKTFTSSTKRNLLTDSQASRKAGLSMKKSAPTTGQAGLFPEDEVAKCRDNHDNDIDSNVSVPRVKGSPTSRAVTYWLAGRKERPTPQVIAGVGRAIKRCFEENPELGEREMRDAIDSLMLRGLDGLPKQYYARFDVRPKRRAPAATATFKHLPKAPTVTPERSAALNAGRSIEASLDDPYVSQTPASPPSWPTWQPESPSTRTVPTTASSAPPEATSEPSVALAENTGSHVDTRLPAFKIERTEGVAPASVTEEIALLERQRIQTDIDYRPPVSHREQVRAALAWLQRGRSSG